MAISGIKRLSYSQLNTYIDAIYDLLKPFGFKDSVRRQPSLSKKRSPYTYPKMLMVTPHPDDESIQAALPLRLQNEAKFEIHNFAYTYGSDVQKRSQRKEELKEALSVLNFIHHDQTTTRLRDLVIKLKPAIIFLAQTGDQHPTHRKTTRAALGAIKKTSYTGLILFWEFWGEQDGANLFVEIPKSILKIQIRALHCHQGELERNPYHIWLIHWMLNQTRRAYENRELVASQKDGLLGPCVALRLVKCKNGNLEEVPSSKLIKQSDHVTKLLFN